MCRFKYVTLIILLEIFLPNNPEKYPEASSMNCFPDYEVMDFDEEFHEPLDLLESQSHIGPQQCRHLCNNTGNCRYVKYDRTQLKCDLFGTEDDEFDVHCDNFYVVRSFKFSQVSDFQMSKKRICVLSRLSYKKKLDNVKFYVCVSQYFSEMRYTKFKLQIVNCKFFV